MDFEQKAWDCIAKCGEEVTIEIKEDNLKTLAVITSVRNKNKSEFINNYTPLGYADERLYTYIGKPNVRLDELKEDTVIKTKTDTYILKRAEKVCVRGKIIYIWALIQRLVKEEI